MRYVAEAFLFRLEACANHPLEDDRCERLAMTAFFFMEEPAPEAYRAICCHRHVSPVLRLRLNARGGVGAGYLLADDGQQRRQSWRMQPFHLSADIPEALATRAIEVAMKVGQATRGSADEGAKRWRSFGARWRPSGACWAVPRT
ncbi:MAG: hypothetical protein N2557_07540 [Hydrogenophilus sp.]|nr:hypothetical protein [Hydrogenophilus sp.]